MMITDLFHLMLKREASDLFLRINAYPRARINGKVQIIGDQRLTKEQITQISDELLQTEQRKRQFLDYLDIDFIYHDERVGRFRINMFTQRGTPSIVARHVHTHTRSFEDLGLPVEVCKLFCDESKGIFLACGPAGNGKSTTIASMIQYINLNYPKHVITIEDPIEFLFSDENSIVNQRELGLDVASYPTALKFVTQQSPDIVYIGNIRDEGTMKAAMTACELGTFVISTLHTVNAVQTIIRMVNFFPPHMHDEVRMQLSLMLKGTISLRLIPRKDGNGRVPAYETMVVTPTVARLIREGRIREIQNFIDEGELFGMKSFKRCLVELVRADVVDEQEARKYADSRDDFDLELKGLKRYND